MLRATFFLVTGTFLSFCAFSQQTCRELHSNMNGPVKSTGDNIRSDTMDVLHTEINLEIMDFAGKTIAGNTRLTIHPKLNAVSSIALDLLKMTIDSLHYEDNNAPYTYNDTVLRAFFPAPIGLTDTVDVTVFYRGAPRMDPSGWGGFYFSGNYAYNLGVGFESYPHNYGRTWYPCFDNFVERCSYAFNITTEGGKVAYCNGMLDTTIVVNADTVVSSWVMNDPIPSYLVSVAVADYTHSTQYYTSTTSDVIPMWLTARPSDTTDMVNSFANLGGAMLAFENSYGPYIWNRVGFCLVPFNSGAMEHATNIAYPLAVANGTLASQTLMAHELSHHWWGDAVTCRTAEEMWINEGLASYSEMIFLEHVVGDYAYLNEMRSNHKNVLHKAHISDGDYYALTAVPQEVTYGAHSYDKGADVAHTLRGYLGDTDFFSGISSFVTNHKFQDVSSADFRDHLNAVLSQDVTDFFDQWIMKPGFPQFSIDSVLVTPTTGLYDISVYVKQRLTAAPGFFNNVPLTVTFMDANWNKHEEQIIVSGETSSFNLSSPINPVFSALNMDERISDATTGEVQVLNSVGTKVFNYGMMNVTVNTITDSAFVRVVHNWTGPDAFSPPNYEYVLAPNRYWSFDGIFPTSFTASGRIIYDGRTSGNGYLDHLWMKDTNNLVFTEDSLVLLYRLNASEQWREFWDYNLQTQASKTDKFGYVEINELVKGEYAFAVRYSGLGVRERKKKQTGLNIFPNPSAGSIQLDFPSMAGDSATILISDMQGKAVFSGATKGGSAVISTIDWKPGSYVVSISSSGGTTAAGTVVKR